MIKKIFYLLTSVLFISTISSCTSTTVNSDVSPTYNENSTEQAKKDKVKKYKNAMFWEINGTDNNGSPSKVYILGTIHVGDERLYPLPDYIDAAYTSADRIVGELSTDAWEVMSIALNKKKEDSTAREKERIKQSGKTLSDYLTEEEKNFLLSYVKDEKILNKFEPWFLLSEISDIPVTLSGLDSTKSYDIYFIERSLKEKKYIEGLDTIENQLQELSYGDWNTQLTILKNTIDNLIKESDSAGKNIINLYETYLTADEKKLSKIINTSINNKKSEYSDNYYESVILEKNKSWAEKIENYLKEGGTTFVFAGCGYFIGENSVLQFIK